MQGLHPQLLLGALLCANLGDVSSAPCIPTQLKFEECRVVPGR